MIKTSYHPYLPCLSLYKLQTKLVILLVHKSSFSDKIKKSENGTIQVSNQIENLSFNKANYVPVVIKVSENSKSTPSNSRHRPRHDCPQAPEHGATSMLACPGRLSLGGQRPALALCAWVPSALLQVQRCETYVFACFGHGFSPFSLQNQMFKSPIRQK